MSKITCSKEIAVVKIFIKVITGFLFLFSSVSWGVDTSSTNSSKDDGTKSLSQSSSPAQTNQGDIQSIYPAKNLEVEKYLRADDAKIREAENCKSAAEQIRAERKAISDACKEASLGSTESCIEKTEACGEASSGGSYDTIGSFAKALGVPSEVTSAFDPAFGNACPQMAGQDYFSEKDKLEKELKDLQQELAELDNEKADIEDDTTKDINEIQETLTKANEELKDKKLNISKESRERIAAFNETQNQAKEELRKKSTELLGVRGDLIQSQRDKTLRLLAMSESAGERACEKAVDEARNRFNSSGNGSMSKGIGKGNKKKKTLIEIYKDCMSSFDQQRVALNESKRIEQDKLNKRIDDLQSSMDEIQNTINLASTQLQQIQDNATQEEANAIQSVIDLGKRSQFQIEAANQKMQKKLQALAKKSQSLNDAINRITNSINVLGPPPERSSSSTPRQISSAISSAYENIEDIKAEFSDCKNLDPKGKGKNASSSSSSAKKAGQ